MNDEQAIKHGIKQLSEQVYEATEKWFKAQQKKIVTYSEKGTAVVKILQDNVDHVADTYAKILADLFSVILEETITLPAEVKYKVGVAVIPTANTNGHSYPLNKTYVCAKGNTFYTAAAYPYGNNMESNFANIKMPTVEQIEEFLTKFQSTNDALFNTFMQAMNGDK